MSEVAGWRAIFLVMSVVTALILLGVWRTVESRPSEAAALHLRGAFLLTSGTGLVLVALTAVSQPAVPIVVDIGAALLGVALLAGYVLVSRDNPRAMIPPHLIVETRFLRSSVAAFSRDVRAGQPAGGHPALPHRHPRPRSRTAGLLFFALPVSMAAFAPGVGRLVDHAQPRTVLRAGLLVLIVGSVVTGLVATDEESVGRIVAVCALLLVLGAGVAMVQTPAAAGATRSPAGQTGAALGLFNMLRFSGLDRRHRLGGAQLRAHRDAGRAGGLRGRRGAGAAGQLRRAEPARARAGRDDRSGPGAAGRIDRLNVATASTPPTLTSLQQRYGDGRDLQQRGGERGARDEAGEDLQAVPDGSAGPCAGSSRITTVVSVPVRYVVESPETPNRWIALLCRPSAAALSASRGRKTFSSGADPALHHQAAKIANSTSSTVRAVLTARGHTGSSSWALPAVRAPIAAPSMKLAIATLTRPTACRSRSAAPTPSSTMLPVMTLVKALPRARKPMASVAPLVMARTTTRRAR